MVSLPISTVFWSLAVIHVLGILSAWLVRIQAGSAHQTLCQRVFFLFFCLVGLATIAATSVAPHHWLISGATLSLMVLTVVWDFSGSFEAKPA